MEFYEVLPELRKTLLIITNKGGLGRLPPFLSRFLLYWSKIQDAKIATVHLASPLHGAEYNIIDAFRFSLQIYFVPPLVLHFRHSIVEINPLVPGVH